MAEKPNQMGGYELKEIKMAKDKEGHGSEGRASPRKVGGASIEQERDGSFSVYRAGNPHATTGGFKTSNEAEGASKGYLNSPEHHGRWNVAAGKGALSSESMKSEGTPKRVLEHIRNQKKYQLNKPPSQRRSLP